MTANNIIFEQPINEQNRVCLKLEYLFEQADNYLNFRSSWDIRQALNTILEILYICDRPDLKNKLGQLLTQYSSSLLYLEKLPGVDKEKLDGMLKKIDQLIDLLHFDTQRLGQELRANEFLTSIQHRLYIPAGTCTFSLPSYGAWLENDPELLKQQLLKWLKKFDHIREITAFILKLVRESVPFKPVKAIKGFFQINLDSNINYQLIRIKMDSSNLVFPEISVGRHRLSINFFSIDIHGNTTQTDKDLDFELACCKL